MDGLRVYVLFNSISAISRRFKDVYESLCAVEPRIRLKRFPPQTGVELKTVRSAFQRLAH